MKAVILGCGRVGSLLASLLFDSGWGVSVVDADPEAFSGLGDNFSGLRVNGRITNEDTLRLAAIESADIVVVLTSDDLSNLMAGQMALRTFGRQKVLVRVRDPIKAKAYREIGIQTVCPTDIELDLLKRELGIQPKK
jgi:trk system potassium uptake protein TrkA